MSGEDDDTNTFKRRVPFGRMSIPSFSAEGNHSVRAVYDFGSGDHTQMSQAIFSIPSLSDLENEDSGPQKSTSTQPKSGQRPQLNSRQKKRRAKNVDACLNDPDAKMPYRGENSGARQPGRLNDGETLKPIFVKVKSAAAKYYVDNDGQMWSDLKAPKFVSLRNEETALELPGFSSKPAVEATDFSRAPDPHFRGLPLGSKYYLPRESINKKGNDVLSGYETQSSAGNDDDSSDEYLLSVSSPEKSKVYTSQFFPPSCQKLPTENHERKRKATEERECAECESSAPAIKKAFSRDRCKERERLIDPAAFQSAANELEDALTKVRQVLGLAPSLQAARPSEHRNAPTRQVYRTPAVPLDEVHLRSSYYPVPAPTYSYYHPHSYQGGPAYWPNEAHNSHPIAYDPYYHGWASCPPSQQAGRVGGPGGEPRMAADIPTAAPRVNHSPRQLL